MDSSLWGLTNKGFKRPTYLELLDAIEFKAKEQYGPEINVSVRSALGVFLRIIAWMASIVWMAAEDVYNAGYIDTAAGTSLLNLGRLIGLKLNSAAKSQTTLRVEGKPWLSIPAGFLAATEAGRKYVTRVDGRIQESGFAEIPAQAFEPGPDGDCEPGAITKIVNPVANVYSVVNPIAARGGAGRETDEQFRDRYYRSVDFAGGVNADAINAEILQTAEGIISSKTFENDTDFWRDGMPPHSVEAVCQGAQDADIAKAVYRRKSAGIQTCGNTCAIVAASSGQAAEIWFRRPAAIGVRVQVTGLVVNPKYSAEAARENLRAAAAAFVEGLGPGDPLYCNELFCALNKAEGALTYNLKTGFLSGPMSQDSLTPSSREKLALDPEAVTFA
jgi:uncharacterized phage protein gp47/JayE